MVWGRVRGGRIASILPKGSLAAFVILLGGVPAAWGQAGDVVLPRLTPAKALYYRSHPDAWQRVLAGLPRLPARGVPTSPDQAQPAVGGSWRVVTTAPARVSNPLLLTDGSVLFSLGDTPDWYRLTPDAFGNYADGVWTQVASLPVIGGTQYAPLYFSSAVLPDGRAIVMGGEYNSSATYNATNLGAIYDPQANSWTPVAAPAGVAWARIGDAPSTVLADGNFLLGGCCGQPSVDALFDAATLTWTATGAPNLTQFQAESGYSLLQDDSVLTVDTYPAPATNNRPPTTAERYLSSTGAWVPAGNTPESLTDPGTVSCDQEIGPAVVRPDGTVVAFGGYSGCNHDQTPDPIAIYHPIDGSWSAGPNLPAICGANGSEICSLADAPAALLPNGNILFATSGQNDGYGEAPTLFFEFTADNTLQPVATPILNTDVEQAAFYNMVVLPTGQVLATDSFETPEIYTPIGAAASAWAPAIGDAPSTIAPGGVYPISGMQFNGLSQGAYFGDDAQAFTNYPIIRITNTASGHVVYARSFGHSTRSIAPGTAASTNFAVPAGIELGPSTLAVIANGIASEPVVVTVAVPDLLTASVLPGSRSVILGQTATIFATMINTGPAALKNCRIGLPGAAPAGLTLDYQTTDPTTNALTGTPDVPVTIAGGNGAQSFEVAFKSSATFSALDLVLDFDCDGSAPADWLPGVDTIDLNFSTTPTPDIVALAAAAGGIMTIPLSKAQAGAFAAATFDAGSAGTMTVTADTGAGNLPVTLTLCASDAVTAACLASPASSVQTSFPPNGTQTYSIFATASAPIAFAPGSSRVFLRFTDAGGILRGSTSVAVQTE
jgi:hypothetical protein